MDLDRRSKQRDAFYWIAQALVLYTLVGGLICFLAWPLDRPALAGWFGASIIIQPVTALTAVCAGLALLAMLNGRWRWGIAPALVTSVLGALAVFENLTGISLGISQWLTFNRPWGSLGTTAPGRMGMPAGVAWTLIGAAALLLSLRHPRQALAISMSLVALAIAGLSVIGYSYGADQLFAVPRFTAIALQTATFLAASSLALLITTIHNGPLGILVKRSTSGLLARRLIPTAIALPLVLGWLALNGQRSQYFDPAFATAALVLILSALLVTTAWWAISICHTAETTAAQSIRGAVALSEMKDQFVVFNRNFQYAYVNPPLEEVTGMKSADLLGKVLWEVFPAVLGTELETVMRRVMATRQAEALDYHYRPWDRWFHCRVFAVPDDSIGMVVNEVTAARRRDDALRASEARMQLAMQIADAGTWDLDLITGVNHWSDSHFTMLGLEPTPDRTAPREFWENAIHPEDLPGVIVDWDRAVQTKELFVSEHRLRRADDGRTIWIRAAGRFTFDSTGRPIRFTGVFFDITDRKKDEQALKDSENVFRTLGEALPDFLWMSDAQGRPIYQNPAWRAYTGLTQEDLLRDGWQRMPHPDDLPRLQKIWNEASAQGQSFSVEYRCRRHDGQYRWFMSRTVPVRDDSGAIIRWVGTTTDIHDLRQSEAALRDAARHKDEFLATLAHELRNPMASLVSSLELLRQGDAIAPSNQRICDTMHRNLSHLVRLIDDLLDVSRINTGKLNLRKERVSLQTAITDALGLTHPLAMEAGHRIDLSLPETPVYLEGDAVRLAQIFGNLISNACKYTPPGGLINISAAADGKDVTVVIRDNGAGIAPDLIGKLFEMFAQIDRTLGQAKGGLGIGLGLVKRLVELHNGTVSAASDGVGKGSTFTVRLPLATGVAVSVPTDTKKPGSAPLAPQRILVVDDNIDAADALALLLELDEHQTSTAYNGESAIAMAESMRPTVMLLDIGLPDRSGYEVCKAIRGQSWGREITIIALTGWGQDDDRRRTESAGFDAHLVKPVEVETVRRVIEKMCSQQPVATQPV